MKKIMLLIFLVFVSCKRGTDKENTSNTNQEIKKESYLNLSLTAVVEKNDIFKLYYMKDGEAAISEANMVKVEASGSNDPQDLNFIIKDPEMIPSKMFLMFGNEMKDQKVEIISGFVVLGDKSFSFDKEKFYQFFNPNPYVEYDVESGIATTKEVDGEYKPWFRARNVFIEKMLFDLE